MEMREVVWVEVRLNMTVPAEEALVIVLIVLVIVMMMARGMDLLR